MSVMKRKSNIILVTVLVVVLVLVPIWYIALAPSIVISELEKINLTTSFEGTCGKEGYIYTKGVIGAATGLDAWEIPITVTAKIYVTEVKGDNIILRIDATMISSDTGEALPDPFSRNSTYVFSKLTLENVKDAPEADKPREGYDPLYPAHLKAGENMPNVWLDNLNVTATLEFRESTKEEGLTLYTYYVNETVTDMVSLPGIGLRNCTLISTKTILVEPLSGLLAYTKEEIFDWIMNREDQSPLPLVYFKYESTDEAKTDGLATAKMGYEGLQLLELYIPTILGVVAIILTVGLAFNIRRLSKRIP